MPRGTVPGLAPSLAEFVANLPGYAYRCRHDEHWTILFASEGVTGITEYTPDEFASGRVRFGDLIRPDDRARCAAAVATAVARRAPWDIEYRVRARSGRERWILDRGRGVYDADGALVCLEGLIVDVTEKRALHDRLAVLTGELEAEVARRTEALHRREALLSLVMGSVPVMIGYYDANLRLEFANDSYVRALRGARAEDVVGRTLEELLPPERLALNLGAFRRALGGETVRYELAGRTRGALNAALVPDVAPDGTVRGVFATLVDITEYKEVEEALRDREAQLELVTENLPAFVARFDSRHVCRYANTLYAASLGATPAAIVGRRYEDIVDAERAAAEAPYIQCVQAGESVRFEQPYAPAQTGTLDVTLVPFREAAAADAGWFVFAVDVSERKRQEAALRDAEAKLRESQKMEAIGTLAGGIAHDFSNILGVILGNAALARASAAEEPALDGYLAEITRAADQAKRLVQQILTFSRRQPQAFRTQPVGAVVESTLQMLRATVPAMVAIEARLAAAPLYASIDATQVGQVLMNLCTNAWQAMNGRPGRVDVSLDAVDLSDAERRPGELGAGRYVRLTVADDGPGMDDATKARIFEPFYTTKGTQGTGLGLAVVHGIVRAHRGAIVVASAPGEGARFDIYLPAVGEAPLQAGDGRAVALVSKPPPDCRVLYIDDNDAMVRLVERLLARAGCRVDGFAAPGPALDVLAADPRAFDVVLTDYSMPGMTGVEVAQVVAGLRPDLPVVVISGYVTESLRAEALAAGVRHVVYKPEAHRELAAAIRAACDPQSRA